MFRFEPPQNLGGGVKSVNEIGGRDRHKFFRPPVVGGIATNTASAAGLNQAAAAAVAGGRPQAASLRNAVAIPQHQHSFAAPAAAAAAAAAAQQQPRNANSAPARRGAPSTRRLSPMRDANGGSSTGRDRSVGSAAGGDHSGSGAGAREFATQTLMRENDCQTDPFTPDFIFEAGKNPQVYALRELKWGEGLPARQAEIEMIDRINRRRDVEAAIPRGNDDASVKGRLRALEGLEKAEWAEREAHIEMLQQERLGKIEVALVRREQRREEQTRERVEKFREAKMAAVEAQLQRLQDTRFNEARRLGRTHANPTLEAPRKDVIANHASFGPAAEAVKTSSALRTTNPGKVERITANYDVRPTLLSFAEGIQELERTKCVRLETLPEKMLAAPQNKAVEALPTKYRRREANQVLQHLDYAQELIDERKTVKKDATESVQELYRATPRLERPDTPTLALAGDDEEEKDEAIMLLQRLIRGRAVQNEFFEGKERCHGLIEELQAASSAATAEPTWLPQQQAERLAERQEQAVDRVLAEAQGDIVFATVDYLHKELLRLQQQAKVDALRRQAEQDRRQREQQEEARRLAERNRRAEAERVHATVLRAVDSTATTFLDQLLRNTALITAQRQAIEEQQAKTIWEAHSQPFAAQFDPSTHSFATPEAREQFVCNLFDGIVLPTVIVELRGDPTKRAENQRAVAEAAVDAVLSVTDACVGGRKK